MKIPEDDSEDLTDAEVTRSVETSGPQSFGDHVVNLACSVCGARGVSFEHALRRKALHLYSRARMTCPSGHKEAFVFTVDWLKQ